MRRHRAVRLTLEGQKKLKDALTAVWRTEFPGTRQTREARAEYLHLSIATAEKLLAGKPVDKSTIQLAFQRLGLPWSESFCEGDHSHVPDTAQRETRQLDRRISRRVWTLGIASVACLAAFMSWRVATRATEEAAKRAEIMRTQELEESGVKDYNEGRYLEAETKLNAAFKLAASRDLATGMASTVRILGDIAAAKGDLKLARSRYLDALDLRQKVFKLNAGDNSKNFAGAIPPVFEGLGAVEVRMDLFSEARAHFESALEGYREQKVPSGVSMAYRGLGTVACKQQKFDESVRQFKLALQSLNPKDADSDLAYDIRARMAVARAHQGATDEALVTLDACLKHWQEKGHLRWQAETRMQLGQVAELVGQTTEARNHFKKALAEFQAVGDAENARQATQLLGRLSRENARTG